MTQEKYDRQTGHAIRNLEVKVGNLTHQLLATNDHKKSLLIAADLVAAIRELVEERGTDRR